MSRPEAAGPPENYYNEIEAKKYTENSHIIRVQMEMTERAMELLALPDDGGPPKLILDLGCGSGLSGSVIESSGHYWVGMDISRSMLDVAHARMDTDQEPDPKEYAMEAEQQSETDDSDQSYDEDDSDTESVEDDPEKCMGLLHHDMGDGTCFRPGTFDGAISISALQWLCHSNRATENPKARLCRLFTTLFGCLARGARAVFQFYPETATQIDLIMACAMKAGFTGGLVVDFPNSTRAKKYYLCLMTGPGAELPKGLTDGCGATESVAVDKRGKHRGTSARAHDRNWVLSKKELARKRGKQVRPDTKYTARKRRPTF